MLDILFGDINAINVYVMIDTSFLQAWIKIILISAILRSFHFVTLSQ
jgi:hypothetical protein